uniref:Uncharacterized protein C191.01 n=1 Tax=Anthurium amnicola TaxID=1678845 RepID=A0A1D1Z0W5_9ARAE
MESTQKRVTPSGYETKVSSTLDKTENGSTRVDTSASAVPMNMSKPNKTRIEKLPLTPPRSVSFDLSVTTLSIPSDFLNSFTNSPVESIDIPVNDCSEEICVSLKERDTEMKDLVDCNKDFFDTIKQSLLEEKWKEFLKVLYSKREVIPDSKWMESISEILSDNAQFIATFKMITGYYENDDNDINYDDDFQEENDDDCCRSYGSCTISESPYVDITPIRNYPHVLENLEISHPQFFINVKNELGKLSKGLSRRGSTLGRNHLSNDNPLLHPNVEDHSSDQSSDNESSDGTSETLHDEFKRLLVIPRSVMSDCEWETAINECLDPWPTLIDQWEEIIINEIRQKETFNF